jgi:hypothetical protein
MKALSIWQPYASLVAVGEKRIETRIWGTKHRGLLAIHAMQKWDADLWRTSRVSPVEEALRRHDLYSGPEEESHGNLAFGAVLCYVDLLDCVTVVRTKMGVRLGGPRPLDGSDRSEVYNDLLSENELAFSVFQPGRYAWIMRLVHRFEVPIAAPGARRLWEWNESSGGVSAVGRANKERLKYTRRNISER